MAYLAFDMDGTIGSFTVLKRMLCIFNQPAFFIKTPEKIPAVRPDLEKIIAVSYGKFINAILAKEHSGTPLGLFRPGIFDLFKKINQLRQAGLIKGVLIYSNNLTESLVTFVKDVINLAVGAPVIDASFFRYSQDRLNKSGHGNPEKTWAELKQLLMAIGAPETILPNEAVFFDDLVHANLKKSLGTNYINVEEYIHNAPLIDILEVYRKALIDDNKEFEVNQKAILTYIKSCSYDADYNTVDDYLTAILSAKAKGEYKIKGTGPIPANDKRAAKYMSASLNAILGKSSGGSRKTRRHRRRANL